MCFSEIEAIHFQLLEMSTEFVASSIKCEWNFKLFYILFQVFTCFSGVYFHYEALLKYCCIICCSKHSLLSYTGFSCSLSVQSQSEIGEFSSCHFKDEVEVPLPTVFRAALNILHYIHFWFWPFLLCLTIIKFYKCIKKITENHKKYVSPPLNGLQR